MSQMAKLKFIYSVMNAGKSTHLLQLAHNYNTFGNKTLLLTSSLDTRSLEGEQYFIKSRLGVKAEALPLGADDNITSILDRIDYSPVCIVIDEAQFLSVKNVQQLSDVVDFMNIPVVCYGLRTDAFGDFFVGSHELMKHADKIEELKQLCFCQSKATHVLRYDKNYNVVHDGNQVAVGGDDMYLSVCRKHRKTLQSVSFLRANS